MRQRTISTPVSATGICLHSGKTSTIKLKPAPINTGVMFLRNGVLIPALSKHVTKSSLCTTLSNKTESVSTVEHLMAAISAGLIDNIIIEVNADEIPIMDGSALPYVMLLEEAGMREQGDRKKLMRITKEITVKDGSRFVKISPSDFMEFWIEIKFGVQVIDQFCLLHYVYSGKDDFKQKISRARTFGFLADLEKLHACGLAIGASTENAVVVDSNQIINDTGIRYKDEFVRHKMLDAVGDMRLLGYNFIGKYEAFKPSHALNTQLCQQIIDKEAFEFLEFGEREIFQFKDSKVFCL